MEPFLGKERNVTRDNFFTSLSHKLLARNISLVETTNKNKSLPPSAHPKATLHDTKVMQSDSNARYIPGKRVKECVCVKE